MITSFKKDIVWHNTDHTTAFSLLESSENGLSQGEADARLVRYGSNRITPPGKQSPWVRFFRQFQNILIYVLLAAAVITAVLAHWVDTGVIIGVVFINAIIGYIQEGKAEKALEAIRHLLSHHALVRRDGRSTLLPAEALVPGDVVLLQSGDKVPADMRLFKSKELRLDESLLTGESLPVEKSTDIVAADTSITDRKCMVYSGTLVTSGQAGGVVVATGDGTEIGRISALLREVQPLTTPLVKQMDRFGGWLTSAILVIATLTFLFGILVWSYPPVELFMAAVGLAVAAIPEGLPAIMTITLAIGVRHMAQRNAIIRRLPAVETLGSVTVICTDKTGTLTRNEMTVQSVVTAADIFEVEGAGYDPHGGFTLRGKEIIPSEHAVLNELCKAALLCNDAELREEDGMWKLHGDPTEGALMTLGLKAGLDVHFHHEEWPRIDVVPFESAHKFMATLHHDHEDHGFIYVKGAPERILGMSALQRMNNADAPLDREFWHRQMDALARRGQRLLAIACKNTDAHQHELRFSDVESGLTLLGMIAISDPPREDAITAVRQCQAAGIRVKMITGDHAITAMAIGELMHIGDGKTVLTGHELDVMSDEELQRRVQDTDVFARTSPEHKLRLVTALQANMEVVAMTGDGVNDAPALKRADVGIAMGRKGTEVSKEAAEMVLTDDNFTAIADAVQEGRTVYDNIKKTILFTLPTNGGEALTLITAIFLGYTLPITPVQILWINMITEVTLSMALAFEPPEKGVMQRPPRNPRIPLISPLLVWRIVLVSAIQVSGTFGLFLWEMQHGAGIDYARTVAVNALVIFEAFYLFNSRYITESVLNAAGLLGNRYVLTMIGMVIIFQFSLTYLPFMQYLFGTTAITAQSWLAITLVSSSVFFIVEAEKWLMRMVLRN